MNFSPVKCSCNPKVCPTSGLKTCPRIHRGVSILMNRRAAQSASLLKRVGGHRSSSSTSAWGRTSTTTPPSMSRGPARRRGLRSCTTGGPGHRPTRTKIVASARKPQQRSERVTAGLSTVRPRTTGELILLFFKLFYSGHNNSLNLGLPCGFSTRHTTWCTLRALGLAPLPHPPSRVLVGESTSANMVISARLSSTTTVIFWLHFAVIISH